MPFSNTPEGRAKKARYHREYQREWRKLNKTRADAATKKWREANPETVRKAWNAAGKRRRLAHTEREREAGRRRYLSDLVKGREKTRRAANKRRAKLAEIDEHHTSEEWFAILKAHGYRCSYCGVKETKDNRLTRDHYISLAKGGSNAARNLVPSCMLCNKRKWTKDPIRFANELGRLL